MSGAASANLNKAIVLVILMITMTQVGYLESMNSLTSGEETLDESNDVLETGGASQSNFTASVEGADLIIDEPMTNITFQYNASAASGSGSGSGSGGSTPTTTYGNNSWWLVDDIWPGLLYASDPGSLMHEVIGDTL
ncbi:MAG: hypothetical protein QGG62_06900, partial [Candidatus Poseidoniaceae archaeon]|nr:hypothetical protein [Candidatus Poseidoniaceae archaeon]